MGMRKYYRSIAKARMKAMGVKPSMLNSGIMPHGGRLRKLERGQSGRKYLQKLREKKVARWRRVLFGDLADDAYKAQIMEGQRIKRRKMTEKAMKKRRIRSVEPAT